jgi:hypothetical protein
MAAVRSTTTRQKQAADWFYWRPGTSPRRSLPLHDEPLRPPGPLLSDSREAGVIDDARSRQKLDRRTGAALFLALALAVLVYVNAGGGGRAGGDRPPVSHDGASIIQTSTLRLTRGRDLFHLPRQWVIHLAQGEDDNLGDSRLCRRARLAPSRARH